MQNANDKGFVPVLRFMAASDTHIIEAGDSNCDRIKKAINLSYKISEADTNYKKLDAVLFCGDITNSGTENQFLAFKEVTDFALKDETKLLALTAKYHDGGSMGKKSLEFFSKLMGLENDAHTVLNGFHFITISTSKEDDVYYSPYQKVWLKKQLDIAKNDDPNKPIFVAHHEHVKYTVYGSLEIDGWGHDYFHEIFNEYPQIVHLSGHSHYPLNDPRSFWQGEFTAVGTGSMNYLEFTVDNIRKIHPEGYSKEAQFWIVEVGADNSMRFRGFDLIEEKKLCEYFLQSPLSREFSFEKRKAVSSPPLFKSKKVNIDLSSDGAQITFDAASSTDGMPVFLYRVFAFDKSGNELQMVHKLPKYYSAKPDKTVTIDFGNIPVDTKEIHITAENAFGKKSEPLVVSLKILPHNKKTIHLTCKKIF